MSYGSKQVNVGALLNPTEGVSRSLSDLSAMYGRQVDRENSQKMQAEAAAENTRRYDLGQIRLDANEAESKRRAGLIEKRAQTDADRITNTHEAKKSLGEFVTSGGINNHKYELSDNSTKIQGRIADTIGKLETGRKAFESYLLGDNSPETRKVAMTAFDTNYSGGRNAARRLDARNQRQIDYAEFANQLRFVKDPAERERLVKEMSGKVYGEPLAQIQNDIDTGKYLLKGEKQNSIIRKLPPAVMQYLSRKDVLDEFGDGVSGMSRDELMSRERQATSDYNKSGLSSRVSARSSSVSKSGEFKSSDLRSLTEDLGTVDIGWWDNKQVKKAANDMLDQGHHPVAIASALYGTIEKGTFGDSFISKEGDSAAYNAMIKRSLNMSNRLKGNSSGSSSPRTFNPAVDRTVEQVRDSMYQDRKAGRLGDYLPKVNRQTKLDRSLLPTEDSLNGAANNVRPASSNGTRQFPGHNPNYYSQNVPEGDDFVMSEEEKAYDQQRQEEFNSPWPTAKRFGRDLLQGVSTLPPTGLGTAANFIRGGNLGSKALLTRPLTRVGANNRSAVVKKLADEAGDAVVAAKKTAAAGKDPSKAVKDIASKRARKLEEAHARVQRVNPELVRTKELSKVEKETVQMWKNYKESK